MKRLLRTTFKLALLAGVIAGGVIVARKLMGGLGPESGAPTPSTEWPSMTSDNAPAAATTSTPTAATEPTNGNGARVTVD